MEWEERCGILIAQLESKRVERVVAEKAMERGREIYVPRRRAGWQWVERGGGY